MTTIDKNLFYKLCDLDKLEFTESESEKIMKDLQRIIQFVEKLNDLPIDNVEPLIYVNDEPGRCREDKVEYVVSREEALKNAPQKDTDYIKVPKVLQK